MMFEVHYMEYITRKDVQNSIDRNVFVFGDNDKRIGYGGQAKEMRGEPNAIGIRVKKAPSMDPSAFYTDNEYSENIRKINEDLIHLGKMAHGKTIIFPVAGIGTGMAKLQITAPRTFEYLTNALSKIFDIDNGIFITPQTFL